MLQNPKRYTITAALPYTNGPIHIGHLIIANHVAEYSDVKQVWMVVTPHNPLKKKETLLNDSIRLELESTGNGSCNRNKAKLCFLVPFHVLCVLFFYNFLKRLYSKSKTPTKNRVHSMVKR